MASAKKLFLSHKEGLPWLPDFEEVLQDVLGIEPILLEQQPRKGVAPRELAESYMKQCDGILFLLTRDLVSGEAWHPSTSVAIELEIGRDVFPRERRIYMLEDGVKFPAMADLTTYIGFSPERMLSAIVKLTKDLREAGLLAVAHPVSGSPPLVEDETFYLLETLAQSPENRLRPDDLFSSYNQKYGRDRADFNVLLSQLEAEGFVGPDSRLFHGPGGGVVSKISLIRIVPKGLNEFGARRAEKRARESAALTKTLKHLGLIKKTQGSG